MVEQVIKYLVFSIVSVIFAGIAVLYRWQYLKQEKKKSVDIIKCQKKAMICFSVSYLLISILGLIVQGRKELDIFALMQAIILWDGLFCIAIIDFQIKKIPNHILLLLLCVRIIGILIEGLLTSAGLIPTLLSSVLGMVVGGFIILTCMLLSRGSVGAGDMKLFAIIGLYFRLSGILSVMMYSLFFAAIFSIVMLISKKAKLKSTMPMAPFILAGLSVYYLFL